MGLLFNTTQYRRQEMDHTPKTDRWNIIKKDMILKIILAYFKWHQYGVQYVSVRTFINTTLFNINKPKSIEFTLFNLA